MAFLSKLCHHFSFLLVLFLSLIKSNLDILHSLGKFYIAPDRTHKFHLHSGLNLLPSHYSYSLREKICILQAVENFVKGPTDTMHKTSYWTEIIWRLQVFSNNMKFRALVTVQKQLWEITAERAQRVEQHALGEEENGIWNLYHSNFLWCNLSKVFPLSG